MSEAPHPEVVPAAAVRFDHEQLPLPTYGRCGETIDEDGQVRDADQEWTVRHDTERGVAALV